MTSRRSRRRAASLDSEEEGSKDAEHGLGNYKGSARPVEPLAPLLLYFQQELDELLREEQGLLALEQQ